MPKMESWEPICGIRDAGETARSVAIERDAVFRQGLLLTLMAKRSGDRGNADLAVAIAELMVLGVLSCGILALFRWLGYLDGHVTFSDRPWGFSPPVLAADWGRIAQQFVSYRGV
jgi:hypothetical protein